MEKELFEWDSWDEVDNFHIAFYNVVTKVQIGEILPNTKFELAELDYTTGVLKFYSKDCETALHEFKLQLVVV